MANPSGSNSPRERRGMIPRTGFRLPSGCYGLVEENADGVMLTLEGDGHDLGEVEVVRMGKKILIRIEAR